MLLTGSSLVALVYHHSPPVAALLTLLLLAAWIAPLLALSSLAAPRRAKALEPAPGEGTYDEWLRQARQLGRVLLYYEDNPLLPGEIQQALWEARVDLRDTLKAHPLRDDLERVCRRVRSGAIAAVKNWFGREYRPDIRELANTYEQDVAAGMEENKRLLALQDAVEKAAALMTRNCMPRMLERERLACARDCAWLAVQAAVVHAGRVSPVDLAEMLVIEWSDFSEPWQPARALRNAMARLEPRADAPAAAPAVAAPTPVPVGNLVIRNGRKYRRVRVRRKHHRRHSTYHGPSIWDILVSFGQWVRYSTRSWLLYR
mgnify:CR=1 FL=1